MWNFRTEIEPKWSYLDAFDNHWLGNATLHRRLSRWARKTYNSIFHPKNKGHALSSYNHSYSALSLSNSSSESFRKQYLSKEVADLELPDLNQEALRLQELVFGQQLEF